MNEELYSPPDWFQVAECSKSANRHINWYAKEDKQDPTEALTICNTLCPVKDLCLDYALMQDEDPGGIWGGTLAKQRRVLRKEQDNGT